MITPHARSDAFDCPIVTQASSLLAREMLSAFNAHPIIELRQRDKSKIETIVAHGES